MLGTALLDIYRFRDESLELQIAVCVRIVIERPCGGPAQRLVVETALEGACGPRALEVTSIGV